MYDTLTELIDKIHLGEDATIEFKYIYNSYIQAVLYRGKEKDANNQIDSQDYKGPLDHQIIETMKVRN